MCYQIRAYYWMVTICSKALTAHKHTRLMLNHCTHREWGKQEERGMKTSVLKMASSSLSSSFLHSLLLWPSAWAVIEGRGGGTGVAMVTRQEETVLQCKSRRRARVLLSPPPAGSPLSVPLIPRSDEVNREDPIQLTHRRGIDCFPHWFSLVTLVQPYWSRYHFLCWYASLFKWWHQTSNLEFTC